MSPNNGSCLLELLTPVCESELAGAQVKWACGEVGKEPMRGGPRISALWKVGPLPQLSPRMAATPSICSLFGCTPPGNWLITGD